MGTLGEQFGSEDADGAAGLDADDTFARELLQMNHGINETLLRARLADIDPADTTR